MDAARNESDPVNETIASLSDRLRTPLTVVVAQVEMLIEGEHGQLNAEQRRALERVRRNSARLLRVIEDAEQSLADRP